MAHRALLILLTITLACSVPSQSAAVVREYVVGVPGIAWPGVESRELSSYKLMGGPTQDAQGMTSVTAPFQLSVVEQEQLPGATVTHLHESELVYGLTGTTTLAASNGAPPLSIASGTGAMNSPFQGAHAHRNETAAVARWYGIRLVGTSSLAPTSPPTSRVIYLSPPLTPGAIASGHTADLRLVTMTGSAQTPRLRATFLMVALVVAGTVDAVRDGARTRLASGEAVLAQGTEVVQFAAGSQGARMLTVFVAAPGKPIMTESR